MKAIRKWAGYAGLGIFALLVVTTVGGYVVVSGKFASAFKAAPAIEGQPSIAVFAGEELSVAPLAPMTPRSLDLQNLTEVNPETRAWMRWWWPGGDITAASACEQLAAVDERGIGGVEIQPFSHGLDPVEDEATRARINSFASAEFFAELSDFMHCAEARDMDVYINHLSGWPAGGPQVLLEDGLWSFATAHFDVKGGRAIRKKIPMPKPGVNAYLLGMVEVFFGAGLADFPVDHAEFVSAVAMPRLGGKHAANPLDATDTIELDGEQAIVVDAFVKDGVLTWDAPEGDWTVVFTYILPSGEVPTLIAQQPNGYVVDHLRKEQVIGHYNWAFGEATGLPTHYGRAFKGFFNDSLEFKVDRLAAHDILDEFEERRGYDLRPHLPAIMVDAMDNYFVRDVGGLFATPRYTLSDDDERIRRDYQQTLSDLIIERFLETSADWAAARGLKSRGQSYGMDLDVIRALGANQIPETEQLYAGGSRAFMKMAASAGALYDRPLITAESFVWGQRDFAIAPRQIKAAADMLFASGVNQLIYHGLSYDVEGEAYDEVFGNMPWFPWSGPENISNFSGDYGPRSPMWDAGPELNAYFARAQNILQSGRPDVDVFIYYPFIGFPSFFEETPGLTYTFLFQGFLPDADREEERESAFDLSRTPFLKAPPRGNDERAAWLGKVNALTTELEKRGLTWAWTNSHALQTRGRAAIGAADAGIDHIIVFETEAMELETVEAFEKLAQEGAAFFFLGELPSGQPGFLDADRRDAVIRQRIERLANGQHRSNRVAEVAELIPGGLPMQNNDRVMRVRRLLGETATIDFLTNLSLDVQNTTLAPETADGLNHYWFDAMSGHVWAAATDANGNLSLRLGPLESVFLIASAEELPISGAPLSRQLHEKPVRHVALGGWTLEAGEHERTIDKAFVDTRQDETLRHVQGDLTYTASFNMDKGDNDQAVLLDLGRVEGVARVEVNGRLAGVVSVHPFVIDVSSAVQPGENQLSIRVRPPARNALVGRALDGDPYTSQMVKFENDLVRVGIVGPVSMTMLLAQETTTVPTP